jgi:hypothetical protein
MKTKETCICSVCDKQFKNITDHMLHYMKEHDCGILCIQLDTRLKNYGW